MILNSFLLLIPTTGNSWALAQFTGLGIASLVIKTGVLTLTIDMECKKNMLEDKMFGFICNAGEKMAGEHSIQHAKSLFCGASAVGGARGCHLTEMLHHGTYIIFFSYSIAIVFSVLGASFTYYYWFTSPLP